MFHALGSGVMQLKRTHVGKELTLDGLDEGQWRILSDQEVSEALNWDPRLLEPTDSKPPKKKSTYKRSKQSRNNNKT